MSKNSWTIIRIICGKALHSNLHSGWGSTQCVVAMITAVYTCSYTEPHPKCQFRDTTFWTQWDNQNKRQKNIIWLLHGNWHLSSVVWLINNVVLPYHWRHPAPSQLQSGFLGRDACTILQTPPAPEQVSHYWWSWVGRCACRMLHRWHQLQEWKHHVMITCVNV